MKWTHSTYVVTVVQVLRGEGTEVKQFVKKETPTEIMEDGYNHGKRATIEKDYEIREVPKVETVERQVYRQECDTLDMVRLIDAVNKSPVNKAPAAGE